MKRTASRVAWMVGAIGLALPGGLAAQERVAGAPGAATFDVAAQGPQMMKMRVPLEARVVTGAPYSADVVTENIETLADGNRIVHRTTGRVYRDGQGRTRREENGDGTVSQMVFVTDPVGHVSYTITPAERIVLKSDGAPVDTVFFNTGGGQMIYMKQRADPGELERKREVERKIATDKIVADKMTASEGGKIYAFEDNMVVARESSGPAWDEQVEKLAARQVEGVMAEGTRTTRTIPAGAIGNERPIVTTIEEWRSPDLQVLVSTTTSDPRAGDHTYKLENIVKGEPDPSLFQAPAGYTVKDVKIRENVTIKRDPRQ
jgi:hypothetical protein